MYRINRYGDTSSSLGKPEQVAFQAENLHSLCTKAVLMHHAEVGDDTCRAICPARAGKSYYHYTGRSYAAHSNHELVSSGISEQPNLSFMHGLK